METALIIIGSLVGVVVILNIYARVKMKSTPPVADHKDIVTLSEKNFQQQTKGKVVLVDFWAAWWHYVQHFFTPMGYRISLCFHGTFHLEPRARR